MLLDGCGGGGGRLSRVNRYAFSMRDHGGHGGREGEPSNYHQRVSQRGGDEQLRMFWARDRIVEQLERVV